MRNCGGIFLLKCKKQNCIFLLKYVIILNKDYEINDFRRG